MAYPMQVNHWMLSHDNIWSPTGMRPPGAASPCSGSGKGVPCLKALSWEA